MIANMLISVTINIEKVMDDIPGNQSTVSKILGSKIPPPLHKAISTQTNRWQGYF